MTYEKKGPPVLANSVEIVGPFGNWKELKEEINDVLEELAKFIINDIKLYREPDGWMALIWYKPVPKRGE